MAVFEFGDVLGVFEVRGLVGGKSRDSRRVANEFYTTEGMITGGKFHPSGGGKAEKLADCGGGVQPGGIFGNFMNCVRSRKRDELNAEALEGHYSAALCHLANASYRLGDVVPFDNDRKAFGDDKVVLDTFKALENNLTHGVRLKLDGLKYRLGRTLAFDPAKEKFVGDAQADKLLTREYRAPYVVPETV